MSPRRGPAALVAALLAFASALVTLYWLLGGTAGLDTVGGELEPPYGRAGGRPDGPGRAGRVRRADEATRSGGSSRGSQDRAKGGYVAGSGVGSSGFPPGYLSASGSSFVDFVNQEAAHLLPGRRGLPASSAADLAPHGTTIVTASFPGGVVMGGDRRATMGNLIASRDIDKVFAADEYSVVGIAGTAGIAGELVRLFQVELEHYEKIEGTTLSLDGKANRLAAMIRGNLGAAMQGLAVVPLFAGVDVRPDHDPVTDEDAVETPPETLHGRIFGYDVTGGLYEERGYHAVGSGSLFAKGSLKKTWNQRMSEEQVVHSVIEALYDAADEDSATGGPDMVRRLMPSVFVVTSTGIRRLDDEAVTAVAADVIAARQESAL